MVSMYSWRPRLYLYIHHVCTYIIQLYSIVTFVIIYSITTSVPVLIYSIVTMPWSRPSRRRIGALVVMAALAPVFLLDRHPAAPRAPSFGTGAGVTATTPLPLLRAQGIVEEAVAAARPLLRAPGFVEDAVAAARQVGVESGLALRGDLVEHKFDRAADPLQPPPMRREPSPVIAAPPRGMAFVSGASNATTMGRQERMVIGVLMVESRCDARVRRRSSFGGILF